MKKPDTPRPSQNNPALLTVMRNTIAQHRMFAAGDHVVVAVSGGADSVALLTALHELGPEMNLRLTVAHLNHGLRGDAAQREADFVKNLALKLAVPCICELRNVAEETQANGESLQEAARTVRYQFLFDVLARCNAQKIALGHTMDDQAETVLIRLLRGASTRGLGGIPPVRGDTIVRPLIQVRRTSIEHFLQERGIQFVPDTSVDELHYLRNTIRHELIPLLARQYNPRVVETLCTTAALARDDESVLQDAAANIAGEALKQTDDSIRIPVNLLEKHPQLAGRIVRRAFELLNGSCRGLTSIHTDSVIALLNSQGSNKKVSITGGLIVQREYDDLVMSLEHNPASFHVQIDRLPADVRLPQINTRIQVRTDTINDDAKLQRTDMSDTVHLAADSITLPLVIRPWKPGDRIRPFGFNAEKKIKAVFAEKKIPVRLRSRIPLIESGGRIISAGTLCIAERCRVTPPCSDVIAVTITGINKP